MTDDRLRNLHTLARRYCMDEASRWSEIYSGMPQRQMFGDYTEEAYRTFPRYNALYAILEGVETLEPDASPSLEVLRKNLIEAAATENRMTHPPANPIAQDAMDEERKKFAAFVASIDENDLYDVEPLAYRRKLSSDELATAAQGLAERWMTDLGYWYPLAEKADGLSVEAFHTEIFAREFGYDRLYEILARRGVDRVIEISEGGSDGYEVDVTGSTATYPTLDFGERWWTDKEASFIIYASHESSITLAGWVFEEVQRSWPAWATHVYMGWDQV